MEKLSLLKQAYATIEAAKSGTKRDNVADSKLLLENEKIQVNHIYKERPKLGEPVLLVPKHHCRTRWQRKSLLNFTTPDSMIDSAIATVGSGREHPIWVVKDLEPLSLRIPLTEKRIKIPEVATDVWPLNIYQTFRDAQGACETVYDYMFLRENTDLNSMKSRIRRIGDEGGTIGAFAEEGPQSKLMEAYKGFGTFLKMAKFGEFQIWPISISSDGKYDYTATFGKVMQASEIGNSKTALSEAVKEIMKELARNLPEKYRGVYAELV